MPQLLWVVCLALLSRQRYQHRFKYLKEWDLRMVWPLEYVLMQASASVLVSISVTLTLVVKIVLVSTGISIFVIR